jgi:hypothetical protein
MSSPSERSGAKSATGGGSLRLWRDSLVVAEVALGLVTDAASDNENYVLSPAYLVLEA